MKRLHKSRNDRVLAGVCGGIAEFFGIDPTLVRLAWAVMIFFGGSGLLLYIICALIIPTIPGTPTMVPPRTREWIWTAPTKTAAGADCENGFCSPGLWARAVKDRGVPATAVPCGAKLWQGSHVNLNKK